MSAQCPGPLLRACVGALIAGIAVTACGTAMADDRPPAQGQPAETSRNAASGGEDEPGKAQPDKPATQDAAESASPAAGRAAEAVNPFTPSSGIRLIRYGRATRIYGIR